MLRSDLNFEAGKREKVLGTWDEMTAGHKVNVKLNAEIASITGAEGNFALKTKTGEKVYLETAEPGDFFGAEKP